MRIPDEVIEAVRSATDIVELIGEHLPLRQSGRRFKALCPFHTEKTPSFMVNPELQIFHCFGCGVGGNVFTFLMRHEGLTFLDALELLAGRAGISLPRRADDEAGSGGAGRVLAAIEEALRMYERNLWERQAGAKARRYLEERGLTEETAREARLGYALAGFDHLRPRLQSKVGLKELLEAGLLVDREGGRPYDRFRDRLMFPITGSGGRPVGFGARSLDGSDPKYLNSPETSLYRKRNILYGLHLARRAIAAEGGVWVVEGYMDVLALRQAGLGHVVSVSGTALSDSQAKTLSRYAPQVVLLFDGDEAGQKAAVRSLPPLLQEGLKVRVAPLPSGEDPDSLVGKGGRQAMEKLARGGSSVVNFIVSLCQKSDQEETSKLGGESPVRLALTTDAREAALRQLVELGSRIPDRVTRRLMAEEVSRRLMFDEATLAEEFESRRAIGRRTDERRQTRQSAPARPQRSRTGRPDRRLSTLLGLALADPGVFELMRRELAPADLPEGAVRRLYAYLLDRRAAGVAISPAHLAPQCADTDPEVAELLTALSIAQLPDDRQRAGTELIGSYQADRRRRELEALQREIRARESAGQTEEVPALLARVQELMEQIGSG